MEKRVLVAIFLSFLVVAIYQWLLPTPPRPAATQSATNAASQTPATTAQTPTTSTPSSPAAGTVATPQTAAPAASVAAPIEADTADRDIVVETASIRAVFTTAGATL